MPYRTLCAITRRAYLLLLSTLAGLTLTGCQSDRPRVPDLPKQPDRWISSIVLDADSKVTYVGTSKDLLITDVSSLKQVGGVRSISVGDKLNGVRIGAIQCSFHWRDAKSGGQQFMWRGRWACMAGRSREEIETAVADDGTKRHDYIHIAPVGLQAE